MKNRYQELSKREAERLGVDIVVSDGDTLTISCIAPIGKIWSATETQELIACREAGESLSKLWQWFYNDLKMGLEKLEELQ